MVLVDTSVWIEWLIGSSTGRMISTQLPQREQWIVPTIVQLELLKWLMRTVDGDKIDKVIAFTETC